MVKKLLNYFIHNCQKRGHVYRFIQAWEASPCLYKEKTGEIKYLLLATSDDPITDEDILKDLIIQNPNNTRYLINLECKYCGHRISIEDSLYLPKYNI